MSFLRRRFGGTQNDDHVSSPELSRTPTPDPEHERPANLRVITAEKLHTLQKGSKSKNGKRKNFWIFALGGLVGVMAAAFFAGSNDMIDLSSLEGVNLDSILDALPAGFLSEARELQVRRPSCRAVRGTRWKGSADLPVSVEARTRRRQLRLLRRRTACPLAGRRRRPPGHHDPRRHIHGPRVLGHRRRLAPVLSQETVGLLVHDARPGAGQAELEEAYHAGHQDRS